MEKTSFHFPFEFYNTKNKNCANTNRYDRKCGKFVPRKGANKCTDNRKFCSCSEKKSFCHFGGTAYCPKCPTTQKLLYCMCPSLPESCKYPWKPNCLNAPPGGECPCQSQWKQCDAGFELECKRVPKYTQKFYYCVCKEKQTLAPSKEPTTPPSLDLSPLVFPSAFPSPRHKKSPTSAPLESSTTPVKSPTNYPVTKSPSVQCQNTEAQFLIKPQKGVYARCRWMARGQNSQRRINNFCHSFTQFEDTNKKTYVCKRCCKICRRCTTCSDVCP
uniref:Uncharacterized protein n=1 Tax=Corethron hystrix TaxID=216773 RepID=A0A7S1BBC0_9STRA|mmetsp:Transcript_20392/g.46270  ORF Transcript_20392/g.46270 Transcript_20392/m.46270 type:complete len:273 (+) Transcript_20392:567-1385(+)